VIREARERLKVRSQLSLAMVKIMTVVKNDCDKHAPSTVNSQAKDEGFIPATLRTISPQGPSQLGPLRTSFHFRTS
jgi:hypothetical protein